MRRLPLAIVMAGLCCFLAGCGEGPGVSPGGDPPRAAGTIDDGSPKFFVGQIECPVCGGRPIAPEHHADVEGGRLYFDSAECLREFNKNSEKHLRKYRSQVGLPAPAESSSGG